MPPEVENFHLVEQQSEVEADETLFNEVKEDVKVDKVEEVKDKKVESIEDKKVEEEDKDLEDDDKDLEEDEEDEEELSPIEGYSRPTFKQISKEFPDFFKKFPEMRDVVGREHAFTEIFETVEDAQSAKENDKDFAFFSEKVTEGDAKSFLEVVKDSGKADFNQFVNNFMPALKELDNSLYVETTAPIFVSALQSAYNDAKRAGNENLENAVLHVSQYLFNDHRFATGEVKLKQPEKKEESEKDEIKQERESLYRERFDFANKDINENLEQKLTRFVTGELPDELSDLDKEILPEKIIKEADKLVASDVTHMNKMKRLWQLAEKEKFDFASRQRILVAAINRYKEVIPEIKRKFVARATGKAVREESRREVVTGSRKGSSNTKRSPKEIDWKQTSDEDLFSGRTTYK